MQAEIKIGPFTLKHLSKERKEELLHNGLENFIVASPYGRNDFVVDRYIRTIEHLFENYPYEANYQPSGVFSIPGIFDHIDEVFAVEGLVSNWMGDLIMVLLGMKPMCMIDNDDFPYPDPADMTNKKFIFSNTLRYWCMQFGMERIAIPSIDDTGAIYCWATKKPSALLLRDLHSKFIEVKDLDLMRSVLLGYDYESTANYMKAYSKSRSKLRKDKWENVEAYVARLVQEYSNKCETSDRDFDEFTTKLMGDIDPT